jgi:hypothetical protein
LGSVASCRKTLGLQYTSFIPTIDPPAQADYSRLGFVGLTLRIAIRDCQGNKSAHVDFPLHFTLEAAHDLPPEWKDVADSSLGAIMFDLGDILNKKRGD